MKTAISALKKRFRHFLVGDLLRQREAQLLLQGGINAAQSRAMTGLQNLKAAEFRVFSQFGEDGILQYLLGNVPIENESFVEIGVQNYVESNTRFLLLHDNWSGTVVDASARDIEYIRNDSISWRHSLQARCAFVTTENVEKILHDAGVPKKLGLLSIDVDGNDYWIWEAIQSFQPAIVVCEYNSIFGNQAAVSIPYQSDFRRTAAHFSNLYFGASLAALCQLAEKKGYIFAGANSAGNNAFFVRKELSEKLAKHSAQSGFVSAKFRESRDASNNLSFLSPKEGLALIGNCKVVSVNGMKEIEIKNLQ